MYPVNQVIVGGSDPMLNGIQDIDSQMKMLESYKQKLQQLKYGQPSMNTKLIWDDIDSELQPLTQEQRNLMFNNEDYLNNYNKLQTLVQAELLNLVKGKIESTKEGKELLESQLKLVKKLKSNIIESTNKEMETFKKFREFSKQNPNSTYEDFIKSNL